MHFPPPGPPPPPGMVPPVSQMQQQLQQMNLGNGPMQTPGMPAPMPPPPFPGMAAPIPPPPPVGIRPPGSMPMGPSWGPLGGWGSAAGGLGHTGGFAAGGGAMGPPPPPGVVPPPNRAMMPPGAPPGLQSRIDPSQIPRPGTAPGELVIFETREQGQHVAPPPAASRFIVRDRGSAGPRHMRSTINLVPFSSDLLNNSQVPFSVAVAPMALPDPEDDPIQVVDLGELGPVRCTRCKAYMNPYMRFMSSGKTFTCNFCSHTNQTPDAYFCHLGPDGLRRDIDERPELCCGSVEFVATPEYCIRPPMLPTHFFLIDVSQTAVATGATATACSCISLVLDDIPQQERTLIGLATFDSSVHYYAMRGPGKQPQMLVMCDVMDVFAPEGAPLLVPVGPNKAELQELLQLIPEMFAQTRINESCAGAAIEAAVNVIKPIGGKIKAFITCLPNFGLHALKQRDSVAVGEKDKLTFLQSQAALLYSTPDGARRVRVHTLALPVTDNVANVFKGADLDAYMCYLSRRVASTLPGTTLVATRDMVTSTIVNTLLVAPSA
ncbi:Sec23/Sec24 trunk domain-containing protein [Dunaliella salina]|uniref:Sec23/Sec24 trunk domain-containing protein n=1 Tax=Dunaliella salina TaxID=3046 RepID=A0ABQ7H499_DUNSA|nr:Sec23/Sec24 trunk domain-containing protein [Dunaliella salina]|eukprot:KAF5841675.1 Sec23/Sec24 trunk domain-containing protein [Dunaliella salina]